MITMHSGHQATKNSYCICEIVLFSYIKGIKGITRFEKNTTQGVLMAPKLSSLASRTFVLLKDIPLFQGFSFQEKQCLSEQWKKKRGALDLQTSLPCMCEPHLLLPITNFPQLKICNFLATWAAWPGDALHTTV